MVDNCRHVNKITPSSDHSILNPQKWMCCVCGTTESVWACLSCSYVACGRYIDEHALKHYEKTKHPLSLEVNEKYCYCYVCDDYILNDNAAGDLKILRSALSAVATQTFSSLAGRGKRMLRSQSLSGMGQSYQRQLHDRDRNHTALWFRRYYLLAKAFTSWKQNTPSIVKRQEEEEELLRQEQLAEEKRLKALQRRLRAYGKLSTDGTESQSIAAAVTSSRRNKPFIPGVTGLRNLGNTCYMNSILQVLRYLISCSNLREFRHYFLNLQEGSSVATTRASSPIATSASTSKKQAKYSAKSNTGHQLTRQTTQECFQHITGSGKKRPGLNGGNGAANKAKKFKLQTTETNNISLSEELHALLRVMWSGKWTLVSPHKMLSAVWQMIPFFKGYSQQDAQEFLCEFLDKLSCDRTAACPPLTSSLSSSPSSEAHTHAVVTCVNSLITQMFQGQLVSQVTCGKCGHKSRTYEPFTDLSLEFPDRYQYRGSEFPVATDPCHVTEMLAKFTEVEHLEGKIYACDQCNSKRRKSSGKPTVLTEVSKQLMLQKLPHVLRLHLKRFMWSGRNHRGKITAHVQFEEDLDIQPYTDTDTNPNTDPHNNPNTQQNCDTSTKPIVNNSAGDNDKEPNKDAIIEPNKEAIMYGYRLSAVVMHHGRGFGSGHYTAYCWNEEADSWVHCNDAKLLMVTVPDVMKCQAYILFYTRQQSANSTENPELLTEKADDDVTFNYENSTIPRFLELKRKLSVDHEGRMELKRRKSNVW